MVSSSLKAANTAFETFEKRWSAYSGAIDVWKRNFSHVEQLFDYGSAIRKVMYTTNVSVKSRKKVLSPTKTPY